MANGGGGRGAYSQVDDVGGTRDEAGGQGKGEAAARKLEAYKMDKLAGIVIKYDV
ncbi:hypothetical protein TRIUR3_28709 [Triticum urartu]|uniref:Uncharacterized protein n=1 Tax=Triticum urartu TaxID=4572 RepID=M7ZBU7_TRIUA|nr:hypothetical protein TRIUR3_28709 [Triticum urartu]